MLLALAFANEFLKTDHSVVKVFHCKSIQVVLSISTEDVAGNHGVEHNSLDDNAVSPENQHIVFDVVTDLANGRIPQDGLQFSEYFIRFEYDRRVIGFMRDYSVSK